MYLVAHAEHRVDWWLIFLPVVNLYEYVVRRVAVKIKPAQGRSLKALDFERQQAPRAVNAPGAPITAQAVRTPSVTMVRLIM